MPKMSMTMETGEFGTWHVSVGEEIQVGQVVCEVMTDKVDMEVESTAAGTVVELLAEPGDTVPVGEPLAWVEADDDGLLDDLLDGGATATPSPTTPPPTPPRPPVPAVASPPAPAPAPPQPPPPAPRAPLDPAPAIEPAIPRARRLAAEHGVDLRSLDGSGPAGAVLVSDVRTRLAEAGPAPGTTPAPAPPAPDTEGPRDFPDVVWAARAAALAPRAGTTATAPTVWADAVLGPGDPPPPAALWTALAVATSHALAEAGPPDVRRRPRVGLALPSPAGPVTVTLSEPHRLRPHDAAAVITDALVQVTRGTVDVALLAPADAVVTWVAGAEQLALPPPGGPLVAIGVGTPMRRVVPVGDGIGVRTVVSLTATPASPLDAGWAAHLLGRVAAGVAATVTNAAKTI
jgi:pyruvate dehydrogenase E2 component (dihydrolipoamide acetyltransferase)